MQSKLKDSEEVMQLEALSSRKKYISQLSDLSGQLKSYKEQISEQQEQLEDFNREKKGQFHAEEIHIVLHKVKHLKDGINDPIVQVYVRTHQHGRRRSKGG